MKFYYAPLEGISGYIYRNAHNTYFQNTDKYFSPFISVTQNDFKYRDINDVLPENNKGLILIPQLLTNNAQGFIEASRRLKELGYDEINFNLGCPSGTVVAKGKGSGFLAKTKELNEFFEEIFAASVTKISVKTRIGKDNPEEFYELIELYNKYPIEELIIHPRIQKDFYKNKPNHSIFRQALNLSKNPVCYNGDIFTVKDYIDFTTEFPEVDKIMLGRGLVANPGLINDILAGVKLDKKLFKDYHDRILEGYTKALSGDRNVLFKMKELWFYMSPMFTDNERYVKKIKKSERLSHYEEAVATLFREQELILN